jgi:predicted TIM-barrel fold metal-dependent hydrolase
MIVAAILYPPPKTNCMKKIFTFLGVFIVSSVFAQTKMDIEKYDPVSTLVVPENKLTRAKFPFIDIHSHQWSMPTQNITALLQEMDLLNMKLMVNLSGRSYKSINGQQGLQDHSYLVNAIKHVKASTPNRIIQFTNVSFIGVGQPGWTENAVKELEADVKAGANGLKVYRELGLSHKDNTGKLLRVDDPRLDPIWEKCGELHIPVLIHTGAPEPFWEPVDEKNERWLEVTLYPDRKYYGTGLPPWNELMQQQHNIIRKHPNTIFIAAHFGWYANDLAKLGTILDSFPNMNIEFGAVIAELGRQPRMAKQFFEKYQDRILFGKDNWIPSEYATYFRVLETEDEYFPYHKKYHAFWRMYGLGLSDEVLKKVYYKNALRIIPNIDKALFVD